jgi:uncharacterized protein (DUF2236 family)
MRFVAGQSRGSIVTHSEDAARLINGERVVVLGWGRAILMQLAHPLVAAGVEDHSTFRSSPLAPIRRLHDTIRAMLALTFGSPQEVRQAIAGINRIHDRVHGTLREPAGRFRAGTPYSAHNPELLTWVELTLLESLPLAYETFVAPLPARMKDAWCHDACENVGLLGVPIDRLPSSFEALQHTIREKLERGDVAVGATARRLARQLLHPPFAPLARPAWRLHQLATIGLLPPDLRDQYGLRWTPDDQRALDRRARLCRAIGAWTPAFLRRWRASRR